MTVTWGDIPREILENIFKNLKREYFQVDFDLRECSLVCKGWTPAAQEAIFTTIDMKSEADVDKLMYIIAYKPFLAGSIKLLEQYYQEFTSDKHIAQLFVLAHFFPQLEKFDSCGFINDSYCEMFYNLINDGKFKYLKTYPKTWNPHQDSLRAAYLISHGKDSITEIDIFRHDETGRNEYKLLHNELSQFSKLNKLHISINSDIEQSVVQYIESVTSLSIRNLHLTFHFPDNSRLTKQDLSKIQPMNNLRYLHIQLWCPLRIDQADYILYIRRKFPNLNELYLNFKNDWYIKLTENNSMVTTTSSVIHQILEYLSKMSAYSVQCMYVDENKLCYLIQQYFLYVDFEGKSTVHLILRSRGESPEDQEASKAYIDLARSEGSKQSEMTVQLYRCSWFSYLENVGHYFDELTIDTDDESDITILLDHVSKHCTRLKSLNIRGNINMESTDEISILHGSHSNLRTLTLYHDFKPKLFPYISVRFPCVETLTINHHNLTEFDLFCAQNDNPDSDSQDPETNKDWKTTYFDLLDFSVKQLVIELMVEEDNFDARLKHIYFKITTHSDEMTRYCHILAPDPNEEYPKKLQDFEMAESATEEEYESKKGDLYYLHYDIKCKFVEKITMIEHPTNFDDLTMEFGVCDA